MSEMSQEVTDEWLQETVDRWLRDNDWDYQKYKDRRPDRSAYNTRMNYEITDLLEWAFIEGFKTGRYYHTTSQKNNPLA